MSDVRASSEAVEQLIGPEVLGLIREKRYTELRAALRPLAPVDVAEVLAEMEPVDAAIAFRLLPKEEAGEVFSYLDEDTDKQEALIHELGASAVRVIEGMEPDDRASLLDELPAALAKRIIASLSPVERRETQIILGYPADSVGRLMTPDYVRVMKEWTVERALVHLREYGWDAEVLTWIYVIDERGKLVADLHLRKLLLADPQRTIESLIEESPVALSAFDDQEEAVRQMSRYDRIALPVVDSEGMLLGIVTADDIAEVAEEEATEDIHKLGGMEALDTSYMVTRFGEMFRKRAGVLCVLLLVQLVTIAVLGAFDEQLERLSILVLFIPLIIACGGNSGTQAASLLIRALALGEVEPREWFKVIRKEMLTGLAMGGAMGALAFGAGLGWSAMSEAGAEVDPARVGLAVGLSVVAIVLWGVTIGSMFPLILQRAKLDPATISSPLVATLMDVSGLLIYLTVAMSVLG